MYPLWNRVIAPTIHAAGARRVVEIGALRGETTVKLLDLLGPSSELHVIDPVPQFDPTEHERRFAGRYCFYRDTSHNVLPKLPVVDAALIDGDHNWYTVYNELKLLAATARRAGSPVPLLFLHDVGWPYGRRDLYYEPERIPEEYRQPYAMKGLRVRRGPNRRTDLLERGGFNPKMNNAEHEGGPRNGVMTALEDFVAEHDREVRVLVLPIYFSLAIVAEEERIASSPRLARAFERLETPEVLRGLLELSERLRIKEVHWGQVVFYTWQDRLERTARRYLNLLKADLVVPPPDLERLEACLETIRAEKVEGDLVQCGGADDAPVFMRGFLQAHAISSPNVWVFQPPSPDPSSDGLIERLRRFELLDERVKLLGSGDLTASPGSQISKLSLLRVGAGADPREVLERLYDRLATGGFVIVDNCANGARRRDVERLIVERTAADLEPLESGAVCWRRVS